MISAIAEDVIQVYILAIAYLHDARIGMVIPADAWYVKEKRSGTFHLWIQEQFLGQEESIVLSNGWALMAVCTCKRGSKIWKVELSNGEMLTLIDRDNVWDILWDAEMAPLRDAKKRQAPSRGKRRKQE